jgi:hypothetical protein
MKRITFERTGGFMGLKVNLSLNLDELPNDQAQTLERLLDEADFFNLPTDLVTRPAPDAFHYTISVEMEIHQHTVRFNDPSAPDSLRPLLNDLSGRARSRKTQM